VHALIIGKTGAGKSNLLHVLILALAMSYRRRSSRFT